MDLIIEFTKNILPIFNIVAFPIFFLIIASFVVYRSGNFGLVSNKIWNFFIGEKKYFDEALDKLEQEEHDVARFNFKNNLKFTEKSQIITFIESIKKYDIDISVYVGLRRYYNPKTDKVKKYKSKDMATSVFIFILMLLILLSLIIAAVFAKAPRGFELFTVLFYIVSMTFFSFLTFSDILEKLKARRARKEIYAKKRKYRNRKS
ncbi:hypothetical protein C2U55_15655 [Enterobacteriaceae bacterium ENNIH3]|nr:hypothetical protein C2U55_15655 [Enterobacteriaceae bacterium ENNIH3]AUV09502.1 hypothetical protein C2U52_26240 [Enterobacteriaceae bacterium ENNIH2]PWF51133.1 hypothetical protein BHT19_0009305 [[Kluyvera] intestini]